MSKPDINNPEWRDAQMWDTLDGEPHNLFNYRAKLRLTTDPNVVKGGSTATFVDGKLTVNLTFDVPGWSGVLFANVRVIYQRPTDGKWVTPIVFQMKRGRDNFGFIDAPVDIDVSDETWVGVMLENDEGVRTDIAVVR